MSDLSGKTALITGALTGIGRATALAFAQEGSRVVVSGRRDDAGQALVTELRALGAEAEFVRADVRHEDDVGLAFLLCVVGAGPAPARWSRFAVFLCHIAKYPGRCLCLRYLYITLQNYLDKGLVWCIMPPYLYEPLQNTGEGLLWV